MTEQSFNLITRRTFAKRVAGYFLGGVLIGGLLIPPTITYHYLENKRPSLERILQKKATTPDEIYSHLLAVFNSGSYVRRDILLDNLTKWEEMDSKNPDHSKKYSRLKVAALNYLDTTSEIVGLDKSKVSLNQEVVYFSSGGDLVSEYKDQRFNIVPIGSIGKIAGYDSFNNQFSVKFDNIEMNWPTSWSSGTSTGILSVSNHSALFSSKELGIKKSDHIAEQIRGYFTEK